MANPVSVRFRDPDVPARLKREAAARRLSASALAEELIEEGLRLRSHPRVIFRDGATGRRAALATGPDIWEVIGGMVGGDVPVEERTARASRVFGLPPEQVAAALDYYAAYPDEIDAEIAANIAATEEAEETWRRRRHLLAG